eukprot:9419997-Pyramimonas_sp.AAC.1
MQRGIMHFGLEGRQHLSTSKKGGWLANESTQSGHASLTCLTTIQRPCGQCSWTRLASTHARLLRRPVMDAHL